MTHPQSPNFGFASRMYHQLSENWQFYATTTGVAATAGGLLHLAGQTPLGGVSLAAATAFTGAAMVYHAYLKDSSQATVLGSAAVGAAGFGAMALASGGGVPLTSAAAAIGFAATAITANVRQLLDLKDNPDAARQLELTERYGGARLPHRVKAKEAPTFNEHGAVTSEDVVNRNGVGDAPVRLNAGWHDLTDEPGFVPQQDVKYLWVIREDGHLITGVEDPGEAPQAFATDLTALSPESRTAIDGLGHPTLAAVVGRDETRVGAGRIGGELEFKNGNWVINDHSGRYGSGRGDTSQLLVNAAELFRHNGIQVSHIQSKQGTKDQPVSVNDVRSSMIQGSLAGVSSGISAVARKIAGLLDAGAPQPTMPSVPSTPPPAQHIGGQL